ncbi:hypothetical protein [Gordonia terrae]
MNRQNVTSVTIFAIGAAALLVTRQPASVWLLFGAAALATAVVATRPKVA